MKNTKIAGPVLLLATLPIAACSGRSADPSSSVSSNLTASDGSTMSSAHVTLPPQALGTRQPLPGDPVSYSQLELVKAGYPIRPDSKSNPNEYAHWLKTVSQPMEIVDRGTETLTDIHNSNYVNYPIFTNQCGEIVQALPGYNYVGGAAAWYVPATTTYNSTASYAAVWVGIGGPSPQCGSLSTAPYSGSSNPSYTFWYENPASDPPGRGEISLASPTITAGQGVECYLYLGDSNGAWDTSGTVLWLYFSNLSTGLSTGWFKGRWPSNPTKYYGGEMDYIFERPTIGGVMKPFAHLNSNGWAQGPTSYFGYYQNGATSNGIYGEALSFVGMQNGSNFLCGDTLVPNGNGQYDYTSWTGVLWEGYQ